MLEAPFEGGAMNREDAEKWRRENARKLKAPAAKAGGQDVRRTLLQLVLLPLLFFTGVGALGTYILSKTDTGFYASAREAQAVVTARAPDAHDKSGDESRAILTLEFTDGNGRTVHAQAADRGHGFHVRDTANVYYDPEKPEHARLAAADRRMPLGRLFRILLYAFLGLCAVAWFVAGAVRTERL
jgi:hypothetical protein